MANYVLTGKDTITIGNRVLNDFADGDAVKITFPNDIVKIKTGKNQTTIFAKDETGNNCDVEMRLLRGSADDRYFKSQFASYKKDPAAYQLFFGRAIKRLGDGLGSVVSDVIDLSAGVQVREVDYQDNSEGDTNQAVAIYHFKFAIGSSSIG